MNGSNNVSTKLGSKIKCTMCGKPFDYWDMHLPNNRIEFLVGYPSKYDLDRIKLDFCVDCFDKVLDTLIPMCKINPIIGNWFDEMLSKREGDDK